MNLNSTLCYTLLVLGTFLFASTIQASNSNLFREYIGAEFKGVKFSDVPINPNVNFHFILAFAIDYDTSPSPTNGKFNIFWDTQNLSPSDVSSIKNIKPNVKVALSIGGDTVQGNPVYFNPSSIDSWVSNAVSSLTDIIKSYNLDGIDIDYEHFIGDPNTFSECIGRLIKTLKDNKVISFASIAPFDNSEVQSHYFALWSSYRYLIDYVNFQFYAYDQSTTVAQFIDYYNEQSTNYDSEKVLVSFVSDGSTGLGPANGFFDACRILKSQQKLNGIFVYSADDSKANGFLYEKEAQDLLAITSLFASTIQAANSNLFREYIGAQFKGVKFSDVPINPNVNFHFILAFVIDYDTSPSPTNGKFNIFWDTTNLTPFEVSSIKNKHSNVKIALSLGGDSVQSSPVYFNPTSIDSWIANAVSSLTTIIKKYNLDGIDIDYEHFKGDPNTFSHCIGRLIKTLKDNKVISFASIAPFDSPRVQSHYLTLWNRHRDIIDYVNFQFYAYSKSTTVAQFIDYFNTQSSKYYGEKVLASFVSDKNSGLFPGNGIFKACRMLKSQQKLNGIFIFSADSSKANGFRYEKHSQDLLVSPN